MSDVHIFLHLLVSSQYYDTIERYAPDLSHFHDYVRRALPADWAIEKRGIWFVCRPPDRPIPPQGWKIHLSTTLSDAAPLLSSAVRVLREHRLNFKFALDRTILQQLSAKQWSRGGSGKFITIYPRDLDEFKAVIDHLYHALEGYSGPYVLSDRRYKNSAVVYYRYGGFVRRSTRDFKGEATPVISAPDGTLVPDRRLPYFSPPEGAIDPFAQDDDKSVEEDGANTLADGRYVVDHAMVFSVAGGIYAATDRSTGKKVLIKEARPFTSDRPNGCDAVTLLKKEHRLLTILQDAEVGPRPIDFFRDWEHYYLVEEYLDGSTLRHFTASRGPAIRRRLSRSDQEKCLDWYLRLYRKIAVALDRIHQRRISFGDISHHNVIVFGEAEDVRFIDFEGAHEDGIDNPTPLFTPGFAPAKRQVLFENDYYGLGALMLSGLMPVNGMFQLDPGVHRRFVDELQVDLGLPRALADTILELMSDDSSARPGPAVVAARLATLQVPADGPRLGQHRDADDGLRVTRAEAAGLAQSVINYVASTATYERDDRLFPSDPALFTTDPLGVAHGASGVICAIHTVRGVVPDDLVQWVTTRAARRGPDAAPGLYVGSAGIAWVLWDLGLRDHALETVRLSAASPGMGCGADLFYGLSGWGLFQLKLFTTTGDSSYLTHAVAAGGQLLAAQRNEPSGCWWPPSSGEAFYGLAHGGSGVALFLVYLYAATGRADFLETARRALEYELARAVRMPDGGLTWQVHSSTRSVVPYWRYGSAGIGTVLLRYLAMDDHAPFRQTVADIVAEADKKYTIYPTRFFGLSGLGEFFLDLLAFMPEYTSTAEHALRTIVSGIRLFQLHRPEGVAFPGEGLVRISCDYGTGGAGVAMFLDRLAHMKAAPFMIDELLAAADRRPAAALATAAALV